MSAELQSMSQSYVNDKRNLLIFYFYDCFSSSWLWTTDLWLVIITQILQIVTTSTETALAESVISAVRVILASIINYPSVITIFNTSTSSDSAFKSTFLKRKCRFDDIDFPVKCRVTKVYLSWEPGM